MTYIRGLRFKKIMEKIKIYYKEHKDRLIKAIILAVILVAAFITVYIFKHQSDFYISKYDKIIVVVCFALSVGLMAVRVKIKKPIMWILETIIVIGFPIFLFEEFERLVNDMSSFNPSARMINVVLILALAVISYGLSQNAGIAVGISGFIVFVLYLIDYFTIAFRGSPMILSDFLTWKTAVGVMGAYKYVLDGRILSGFFIMSLIFSLALFVSDNEKKITARIIIAVVCIALGVGTYTYVLKSDYINKKGFSGSDFIPIEAAKQNGFILNSFVSLKESFLEPPEGYSAKMVEEIMDKYSYEQDTFATEAVVKPNIIVIMNESFTDLDYLEHVELTEEPIPKFKALNDNCIKGTLISSIFGGNTPNSEFEFLSGNSMAFLPDGMVAYQQLIDSSIPTIPSYLKKYGYSNTAIHLYQPEFFSRNRIYPLLGFDRFINETNSNVEIELIRNDEKDIQGDYALDRCSFESIKKVTAENSDPYFTFCVTVQNHGGYWHWFQDIMVTNAHSDYANDYASIIRITDDEFEKLLNYYSTEVKEPTIIVMYGDHQPNLFDDFYNTIWEGYDYTENQKRYLKAKVPFVIWANYDIEEADMGEMSINYLGPLLMDMAEIPMSDYFCYLNDLRKDVPVISAVGYVDKDGNFFVDSSESDYYDRIKEYEFLQYNYLKGNTRMDFYE